MKKPNLFEDSIDIFISIHPKYAEKILDATKTIELRRRFPSLNGFRGRLLIYSTLPVRSVIGFAEIGIVHFMPIKELRLKFSNKAYITKEDFDEYFIGLTHGFAVELKNPKKFTHPLEMEYLKENYGLVAPQSFRYLNGKHEKIFSYEKTDHEGALRH